MTAVWTKSMGWNGRLRVPQCWPWVPAHHREKTEKWVENPKNVTTNMWAGALCWNSLHMEKPNNIGGFKNIEVIRYFFYNPSILVGLWTTLFSVVCVTFLRTFIFSWQGLWRKRVQFCVKFQWAIPVSHFLPTRVETCSFPKAVILSFHLHPRRTLSAKCRLLQAITTLPTMELFFFYLGAAWLRSS